MKTRIDYIDKAKGLAILGVVLAHANTNSSKILNTDHPILINWLSFFAVATFFFINGFLYNEKCISIPFKAILKKIKAYYIPYVSYNLFFFIFQNLFVKLHILNESKGYYDFRSLLYGFIQVICGKMQPLTGPMWFLRALLLISIMYILIDSLSGRLLGGKYRYIINGIAALAILLLLFSEHAPGTFNFPSACEGFLLFYLGVLYRKFEINSFIKKHLYIITVISFLLTLIVANTSWVGINGSINPLLDQVITIISVVFVISLSQFNIISKLRLLKYLGKSSLEIMSLHFLAFKPISLLLIIFYNLNIEYLSDTPIVLITGFPVIWTILYVISGIAIPVAFYTIKSAAKKFGNKQSSNNV